MKPAVFLDEWDRHYVRSVRAAARRTFEQAAWMPPEQVYTILAEELRRRGVDPEPDAVYEGAMLISRGRKPAVLQNEYES